MACEKVVVPVRKVALDVFLVMCVGFPILFLFLWGVPFHRGFYCDDQDLMHPFHTSTVSSIYLYLVGILLNSLVMILTEFLNPVQHNVQIVFRGRIIPHWIYSTYYTLLVFAFGMACSQLLTDIMKYTVGRFRPHFITICHPDVCENETRPGTFHTDFQCLSEQRNDSRLMKEMRLSFPSGHSSFSMYTMLYFAIYLQKRMDWDGSKLLKHTLQFLAITAAFFTAMTRISDYKHHWSDVLAGLTIGTIVACVTSRFFSTLFNNSLPDDRLSKQDPNELQGLNGNNLQQQV